LLDSLRLRLYAAFGFIIVVTLGVAGFAFFFPLGGYREDQAYSTLREVALPVYYNVTFFSRANVSVRELTLYFQQQAQDTDIIVLVVDRTGRVVRDAAAEPSLLDETFDLDQSTLSEDFRRLYQGTHRTQDGRELLFVAVPLPPRFALGQLHASAVVVALPKESAGSIIGDLTPRLLLAGLAGLGAAVVVGLVLSRSVYLPLQRVARAAVNVARGNYHEKVPVQGPAEARTLAENFNRMTEAVRGSQQTLRDFLANVSHELKTPLTSIRGFSQALRDGTITEREEQERAARVIENESRRLLYLVEELLDLSRIESGQESMKRTPIQVRELFAHCAEVFSLRARETGVSLEVESEDVPSVLGDFDRLEQVLGNLLDNAFRHTPVGGSVRLSACLSSAGGPQTSLSHRKAGAARDGWVELSVTDSGEGIPPEELAQVFDRFYKGKAALRRAQDEALRQAQDKAGRGTGLGLAISREIVRAHGGEIRAESSPGTGTRFVITLPAAAPDTARTASKKES
jgi:signal transduction histidine kinase